MKDTTLQALLNYRDHGIPTGSFLHAVLCNQLWQAINRADDENLRDIREIVQWVYNGMPISAWGNEEKVANWVKEKAWERDVAKQNKRWPWSLCPDENKTEEGEDGERRRENV